MKKKLLKVLAIIFGIIIGIILIIFIWFISYSVSIPDKEEDIYPIYKINDETTVYSSFKDLKVNKWGKTYDIKDAFEKGKISPFKLYIRTTDIDGYNDGGSLIFRYHKGLFTNKDFVILKCDSSANNKNIYIIQEDDMYNPVCDRIENK